MGHPVAESWPAMSALDIYTRRQVLNIISAAEQAARRDKAGERQAGALEVIDDLRLVFGLAEKQAGYVIEAIHIEGR